MPTSPVRRPKAGALVPRVKVWLETEGRYAFGFGLCEMLDAVARAGSIKRGAADVGKSYRYVWGRIKEAEEALGERLVVARVGGKGVERSRLTPAARRLVDDFLRVRRCMIRAVEEEFARGFGWPVRNRS